MAKSSEYWKKRFLEIEKASNAYGQNTFRQIENTFDKAQMDIQKEIERWYGRYAKNNEITMQEAKKQLTAKELKELRWDVDEYIKYGRENALDQKWMKELENASARFHISRLEALKIRTQHAAEKAFGNELDQIDGMARHVFTEDYYHSLFEMHKGFGIGWEVGQIDERKLNTLISKPWAADGKNFSDRVWGNRTALVNELHQQLTRTCILGKAPDEAINAISKKMNTSKNNAGRLVMTEQAYFHSVAQKEAFKDLDVEEFEIVATLDSHTSDICQEMDGKHFPMEQYEPGVTAPPFHVWCRSVTVPYFDDEWGSNGERAARNAKGQTYYVPADLTYKDWKNGLVGGNGKGLKPVDTMEDLKKQLADKQNLLADLKKQIQDTRNKEKEFIIGSRDYSVFNQMSVENLDKYQQRLKQKEIDLDDQLNKLGADYDRYYDRPKRGTPEREEWNKWKEENNIDPNDLLMKMDSIRDEKREIAKEFKEIDEFKKWKSKFNGVKKQDFVDEINRLTAEEISTQNEIDSIEKKIRELRKAKLKDAQSLGDKIQVIKDNIADNGGVITETDIQEAGKLVAEEFQKKVVKLESDYQEALKEYNVFTKQIDDINQQIQDIMSGGASADDFDPFEVLMNAANNENKFADELDRLDKLKDEILNSKEFLEAQKKYNDAVDAYNGFSDYNSAKWLKETLSEVREMGSDGLDVIGHLNNSRSVMRKYVEDAYSFYPKDWVENSMKRGKLSVKKVDRGYYSDFDQVIAISDRHGIKDGSFEVAVHELGHRMERAIPGIRDAEKAFYNRRTAGESLEWLGAGYSKREVTRRDKFLSAYMGKDYGGSAYELVSMGFEYAYTNPRRLAQDPDMQAWIYGLLCLY